MIAFTEAQKVKGVVMTSSPGPILAARMLRCRAAVQEFMATAKPACLYARKSCSNRATLGPVPSHPVSRQSRTSLFSSSPIRGDPKTKNLSGLRTGLAVFVMIDPESPDGVFERVIFLDECFPFRKIVEELFGRLLFGCPPPVVLRYDNYVLGLAKRHRVHELLPPALLHRRNVAPRSPHHEGIGALR